MISSATMRVFEPKCVNNDLDGLPCNVAHVIHFFNSDISATLTEESLVCLEIVCTAIPANFRLFNPIFNGTKM